MVAAALTLPPLAWLTPGALVAAMPGCKAPGAWAGPLRAACDRFGIVSRRRVAAFVAQIGHESGDLNRLSESLDYSPAGLMATWPRRFPREVAQRLGRTAEHPARQEAIAELCYGQRLGNSIPGDAWRYRGAGLIQITGQAGHNACAVAFGMHTDEMPEWLRTRDGAALSAGWYWRERKLSVPADLGDIDAISRIIQGVSTNERVNGLADRRERYRRARAALLP